MESLASLSAEEFTVSVGSISSDVRVVRYKNPATERPQKSTNKCPLCPVRTAHLKRHVCKEHLPWYLSACTACWFCEHQESNPCLTVACYTEESEGDQMVLFDDQLFVRWCHLVSGVLHFLKESFKVGSLSDLLEYIIAHELFPCEVAGSVHFNNIELALLQAFEIYCDGEAGSVYSISPPSRVVCLIHWRLLCCILSSLDLETCRVFSNVSVHMLLDGTGVSDLVDSTKSQYFIDTHFHLDQLVRKSKYRCLQEAELAFSDSKYSLQYCIANFVFPSSWSRIHHLINGDARVYLTLGVHPHLVESEVDRWARRLEEMISSTPCVGVGEIGLDFTTACKCTIACRNKEICKQRKISCQRKFLHMAIPLAEKYHKVLVLHCRDNGDGSAAVEVLNEIVSLGLTDLPIHRHCFIGTSQEIKMWQETLPNVYFGFTPKAIDDPVTSHAISAVRLDRLLLETDAPYLGKTPWSLPSIANHIARVKNLPTILVLTKCNTNALSLYFP